MADARVVCMYLYISFSAFRSCAGVHVRPPVLPDFPHGRGQGHALCGRHVSILRGLCTVDLLLYAAMRGCRIDEAFFLDRFIFFLLSPLLPFSFYFLVSVCLVLFLSSCVFCVGESYASGATLSRLGLFISVLSRFCNSRSSSS